MKWTVKRCQSVKPVLICYYWHNCCEDLDEAAGSEGKGEVQMDWAEVDVTGLVRSSNLSGFELELKCFCHPERA